MIVYADVLICLNTVVNYLILSVTAKICRLNNTNFRMVGGAFIGSLFSLYIFLPSSGPFTEAVVRLTFSALIVFISFGCKSIKKFLKLVIVFYCVTFAYAGAMLGVWYVLKPYGMVINNGIVYFGISPVMLIAVSTVIYAILVFFSKIRQSASRTNLCELEITCEKKTVQVSALIDSGHLLTDDISGSDVIIVDRKTGEKLFGHITLNTPIYATADLNPGFRVLPYKTVDGEGIMPAFRCESIKIHTDSNILIKSNLIIGVVNRTFSDDYSAIINPSIISG